MTSGLPSGVPGQGQGLGSGREISPRSISPRGISPRGVGGTVTNGSNGTMAGKRLAALTQASQQPPSSNIVAAGRHRQDDSDGQGDAYDQEEFDEYGEDFEADA